MGVVTNGMPLRQDGERRRFTLFGSTRTRNRTKVLAVRQLDLFLMLLLSAQIKDVEKSSITKGESECDW